MNRSVLAAICVPVVVAVALVGTFVLTTKHGGSPDRSSGSQALPGRPAVPGAGHTSQPASPTPGHSRAHKRTSPKAGHSHGHQGSPKSTEGPGGTGPGPTGPLGPPGFVGVAVSGPITPAVEAFSKLTGAHMALVELYVSFGASFPQQQASNIAAAGSTPFIQWNPRHAPLGKVAAGQYNSYVRQYAKAVKAFKSRIFLSFAHEMNGSWGPWGTQHATAAQFIRAWRKIHGIFARNGVTNVTWSWDPSHTGLPANGYWPGSGYVDQIGIDGYQRHGQTFSQIFQRQLANIRSFTSKPIFIAETSVAPSHGASSQIAALFNGVRQYHLAGFVWFDINHLEPWRLEGRPSAIRAFRRSVASWKRAA